MRSLRAQLVGLETKAQSQRTQTFEWKMIHTVEDYEKACRLEDTPDHLLVLIKTF